VPLAGVPFHSVDGYIARLLRAGYKVAVCEQLEDPALAKGLVKRAVTEVLTPGTALTPGLLAERDGHYAMCLAASSDADAAKPMGFAFLDFSTGEFGLGERPAGECFDVVARYAPRELFLPQNCMGSAFEAALTRRFETLPVAHVEDALFTPRLARQALLGHFAVAALDGLDCQDLSEGVRAAGALLEYGSRLKHGRIDAVTRLQVIRSTEEMFLDEDTLANLEIFRSGRGQDASVTLVHHLDACGTAMGSRMLRRWLRAALRDRAQAEARHEAVSWGSTHVEPLEELRGILAQVGDLERLFGRIAADRAAPRDLVAFADSAGRIPSLLERLQSVPGSLIASLRHELDPLADLTDDVRHTLVDEPPPHLREGGVIRPGVSDELDALLDSTRSAREWIAALQTSERAATGIAKLKVGYNKVFGYYLEVTNAHRDKVPADFERRQTLTTAERYVTPELKSREAEVLGADEKLKAREHELFTALRDECAAHVGSLQAAAGALAGLDAQAALAEAAARFEWTRPVLEDSDRLVADGVRHPVVERLLPRGEFVANDVRLNARERQIVLLTGPNMGGKSTYLRQVALLVVLAQSGSWVPAVRATIGLVDRLFTRVGAADRLGAGQSTFMVEMTETADILRSATSRSLVLLDEIGRGTATYDGLALAWAVTEHLHDARTARARTIFATHYHELTQLSERLPRLANAHVTVKEWGDGVVFLHRIADGPADRSYGIHVAQLAGLPASVIERAKVVLAELESERTVEELERRPVRGRKEEIRVPLPLFDVAPPAEHPLAAELRALIPDAMTPLEALQRLAEWKKRFGA
jgi:DNA mismatch repair protein MutS